MYTQASENRGIYIIDHLLYACATLYQFSHYIEAYPMPFTFYCSSKTWCELTRMTLPKSSIFFTEWFIVIPIIFMGCATKCQTTCQSLITIRCDLCEKSPPTHRYPGAVSIRKTVLPGVAIPMLKIRRPNARLIFNMEITIRR